MTFPNIPNFQTTALCVELVSDTFLVFLFPQERRYSADVAKIYSIHITNVIGGMASQCRRCALSSAKAGSTCVPCPPGHYMVSGTGVCKSCPPNSFIRAEQPVGEAACVQCGPNTERNKVMGAKSFPLKNSKYKALTKSISALIYAGLRTQRSPGPRGSFWEFRGFNDLMIHTNYEGIYIYRKYNWTVK